MNRRMILSCVCFQLIRIVAGCWMQSLSAFTSLAKVSLEEQRMKRKYYNLEFASRSHGVVTMPRSLPLSASRTDIVDQQSVWMDAITTTTPPLLSDSVIQGDDATFTLSPQMAVIVFIIGVIPFVIATFEFWRRIAVGAPFGTGSDSVLFPISNVTIGMDGVSPLSSRGKQVLGADSLITAYLIFATVGVVLGIVFYAIFTSPIPS